MKGLVTGGAGFIGSWVVDALVEAGHEVAVVDNLSGGDKGNLNANTAFSELDILDEEIGEVFERLKPDCVFHLAANINVRASIEDPAHDARMNIAGTLHILEQCVRHKVGKVIFSSTTGVYGEKSNLPISESETCNPESPYAITKLATEHYLQFYRRTHGLDCAILRFSNVYGPRQNAQGDAGVVATFFANLLAEKESVIHGDGEQTRDYVFVKDVAAANLLALELSGVFNVGTGVETSVNDLWGKMERVSGIDGKKRHGERLNGELVRNSLDASKIREAGWSPETNLESGLKQTFDFFKKANLARK